MTDDVTPRCQAHSAALRAQERAPVQERQEVGNWTVIANLIARLRDRYSYAESTKDSEAPTLYSYYYGDSDIRLDKDIERFLSGNTLDKLVAENDRLQRSLRFYAEERDGDNGHEARLVLSSLLSERQQARGER